MSELKYTKTVGLIVQIVGALTTTTSFLVSTGALGPKDKIVMAVGAAGVFLGTLLQGVTGQVAFHRNPDGTSAEEAYKK